MRDFDSNHRPKILKDLTEKYYNDNNARKERTNKSCLWKLANQ